MSWFSVVQHSKSAWNKYSFAKNVITGNFVSEFIYQNAIKNSSLHKAIRNVASEVFTLAVSPKLLPLTNEIATTALNHSFSKEKLLYMGGRFWQNFSAGQLITVSKVGFNTVKNATYNYFYNTSSPVEQIKREPPKPSDLSLQITELISCEDPNSSENTKEFINCLKKLEINQASNEAMLLALRPTCKRALRAGVVTATKQAGGLAYDMIIKKVISAVTIPLLYKGTALVISWSYSLFENQICEDLNGYMTTAQEIVHPSYILSAITALNAIEMGYIFWNAKQASLKEGRETDKHQFKQIAHQHLKSSIVKKLEENSFLNLAGIASDQTQIDLIASTFIDETVDLYFDDLKSQKILGLPLVS